MLVVMKKKFEKKIMGDDIVGKKDERKDFFSPEIFFLEKQRFRKWSNCLLHEKIVFIFTRVYILFFRIPDGCDMENHVWMGKMGETQKRCGIVNAISPFFLNSRLSKRV